MPAFASSQGNGVYEIDVTAYKASKDEASMCDGAIAKPAKLALDGDQATLRLNLKPVSAGSLSGYLSYVGYCLGWEGPGLPGESDFKPARVISTHEDVTDAYNGPDSSDALARGVQYPKEVELSWDAGSHECYLIVYVPIMNAISAGNGWQIVRLKADGATMKLVGSLTEGDGALPAELENAYDLLGSTIAGALSKLSSADSYTAASVAALKSAMEAAQVVHSARSAGADEVNAARMALERAIDGLEAKAASGGGDGNGSGTSKSGKSGKSGKDSSGKKLDFQNLEDGVYYLNGAFVKTDRSTASMADAALDHVLTLKVDKGKYALVMKLGSLTFSGKTGYLGSIAYFASGYGTDGYGAPTGKTKAAKVLSYHMRDGQRVSDEYGGDYPARVRVPVISEAKKDGYVPLQMSVPVMEAIAKGMGKQFVYLKLDTASITADAGELSSAAGAGDAQVSGAGATGPADGEGNGLVVAVNTLPSASAGGPSAAGPRSGEADAETSGDVKVSELSSAPAAQAQREDPQPPLRNAFAPAAAIGGGIAAAGAGCALFRRREILLD